MYIKERFMLVAEKKGISKQKFCESIGLTYGNFTGENKTSPINSDAIARLLNLYPDISAKWILIEEGDMYGKDCVDMYMNKGNSNNIIQMKNNEINTAIDKYLSKILDENATLCRLLEKSQEALDKCQSINDKLLSIIDKK